MLLAIDVGNTQTVVGLFDDEGPGHPIVGPDLLHTWRLATLVERTSDELGLLVTQLLDLEGLDVDETISGVAISSGVPRVMAALREMVGKRLSVPLVVIEPGVRTGMPILIDNPKEVGADRIANAVAAHERYGGPTVVVDLGTATTFDAVSERGEYLGGAIAPGVEIGLDALVDRAAALRRVELVEAPRQVIGKGTVEALQSGSVYGCASLVDGMCRRFEDELGPATVVATGGLAPLITPLSSCIQHHEPWLTLYGLRLVYERNVPGR
jgi:type III pantothenate kinase